MRIGFVSAELSTGSSASLWPSVASMFPSGGKDTLVVFPGGRLYSQDPLERMRNSIYELVTPENLDGSIIWSSSLTGMAKSEDVIEAFRSMLSKPMVTIDGKTNSYPQIPNVRFNASEGSKRIVEHCIEHHGARRIAYIRGPEHHNSAQERYRAFLESMKAHGLEVDMDLVSDPVPWEAGDEAVRQLLEERGKIPGRDFDTLLCASDLMLYRASIELSGRGFEIGKDYFACGFNDSLESRLLNVPVTTVRLPYAGLGVNSVLSFRSIAEDRPCKDRELPALPIFRRSCGCKMGHARETLKDVQSIADQVSEIFAIPGNEAWTMLDRTVKSPTETNLRLLLDRLCRSGADVFEVFEIMSCLDGMISTTEEKKTHLQDTVAYLLPSVLDRNISLRNYEDRIRRKAFNAFSNELLQINRITEIDQVIKRNARSLGFEQMHLVVFYEDNSYLVGTDISFPESSLVPELKKPLLDGGVWIAAPLCTETENMGYLLMKSSEFNGQVCDEVRNLVSSALRSSMLFEATRRAQQAAENAEQARTNFFANVGENLRDPLSEISEIVASSALDAEMKKAVLSRISGANSMIDLALGSTGELELSYYTVDLGALLNTFDCYNHIMALPCLILDENRTKQAIQSIVSSIGSSALITAEVQRRGVFIRIGSNGKWNPSTEDPSLLLAQRVIIMQGGTYSIIDNGVSIILPYPTLSGSSPIPWEDGSLACINARPPFSIRDAGIEDVNATVFCEKKRLPSDSGAIFWDMEFKGYNALSGLLGLLSNETYRDMPFLCTSCPKARTMEEAVRAAVEARGRVVLQVGHSSDEIFRWIQDPDVVNCDLGNAVTMARRHEPALVMIALENMEGVTPAILSLISTLRGMKGISQTPAVICSEYLDETLVNAVMGIPNVIVVNTCMLESEEFAMRLRTILGGSELLATNTGAIVKRAQIYICKHATLPVSRWQIADEVHVSEDYLTRIFKKELGLSPWDYLNRYRIWMAGTLLRNTGMSVNDVAVATGFQDQAYFCRVFKKIRGFSPSRVRSIRPKNAKKSEMSKNQ